MQIKIEANEELFNQATQKLSPSQIAGAMRMAINESLTKGRTMVRRSLQDAYNIKTARVNDEKKGLSLKKATNKDLTGQINASHTPIAIKDMNPKFKGVAIAQQVSFKNGRAKKGKILRRSTSQISIEVIKGQRKTIDSAFTIARGTNASNGQQFGTPAIFARGKRGKPDFKFSKSRLPIDSLSTVSVGTAATNKRSLDQYDGPINSYAQQRFVYHIERLIKSVEGLQ